jgi:ABC-type multidrug transport system permease subunit
MWKRIWKLFVARNKEFIRDRSAFGWNILFPFLIILGFSLMFSRQSQAQFKIGILAGPVAHTDRVKTADSAPGERPDFGEFARFMKTDHLEFVYLDSEKQALDKLGQHRIDLVLNPKNGSYWVSSTSPKGYIAEKLLIAGASRPLERLTRRHISGREVPYIEWLFPGILGMNMMFSALFGVGYVVVRYRKNGVLKRMSVTPVRPFEFLTAQIISRMFLLLATTAVVYSGCAAIFGFTCRGSYLALVLVFALGGFSMVSLGLLVAARSSSEEFAGGILNIITWPMMFLSDVWFSLEGSHPLVQKAALLFPLTHMIDSARKIMNDGAGLETISHHILVLTLMSAVFLALGSVLFRWHRS